MHNVIKLFNFPKESDIKKRIPIKSIVDAYQLTKSDENLLRSHIESLELMSALNTSTLLINSSIDDDMEYKEIDIFYCVLKKENESIRLDQRLHYFFQNPTLFIYEHKNKFRFTISKKRKNKVLENESVVEKTFYTNFLQLSDTNYETFFESLSYSSKTIKNLKELFLSYFNVIVHASLVKYLKTYPKKLFDVEVVQQSIAEIESLNTEINRHKELMQSVFSMSEKIEINENILMFESQIKSILNQFNEVD